MKKIILIFLVVFSLLSGEDKYTKFYMTSHKVIGVSDGDTITILTNMDVMLGLSM